MEFSETLKKQIKATVFEFAKIPISCASVGQSANLSILLDMLLEKNLLSPVIRRRQGKRGSRSARNYLLRKALWFARQSHRVMW
jgi:hypothetical protein